MGRYCTTILLGAFLLFQVQPQIAKFILPWFGGGTAVWSTCMLFFQILLLGGYAYAHILSQRFTPKQQALVHTLLLATSLMFLPVTPAESWKPVGDEAPTLRILLLLTASVGLPYLLLAATGPLLQFWFLRDFNGRSPYRLYALSNVGSLSALLSFPFLFEPNLPIRVQAQSWAGLYILFALLCIFCAWRSIPKTQLAAPLSLEGTDPEPDEAPEPSLHDEPIAVPDAATATATATLVQPATRAAATVRTAAPAPAATPAPADKLAWIGLAALPSAALLAVTNAVCQDIAVIPFFWVMPLSVYLLTFILTFDSARWYRPTVMPIALVAVAGFAFLIDGAAFFARSVLVPGITYGSLLFLCGMVCHGELVKRRPASRHVTGFYLAIALGGAVGGMFIALLAPAVFDTYAEVPWILLACAGVAIMATWHKRPVRAGIIPTVVAAAVTGIWLHSSNQVDYVEQTRNFYGRLSVQQVVQPVPQDNTMVIRRTVGLSHGQTLHGQQVFGVKDKVVGMTYYAPNSGVGYVLTKHPAAEKRSLRVGVIGLGAGTLATYARDGDHFVFYELDPEVVRLAEKHFTYLEEARQRGAKIITKIGDGRIQLERGDETFDILVVDAFQSDAIPTHLLTQECAALYGARLAEDGVLAIHITNHHLNLKPIVRGVATKIQRQVRFVGSNEPIENRWALVTRNQDFLAQPALQLTASKEAKSLLWTDDFSSLWHVLK